MTANTNDQDVREYIMSGMTDILPKPLDQQVLAKLLERYCAHLRLINSNANANANANNANDSKEVSSSPSSFSSPAVSSAPHTMSHTKGMTAAAFHLAPFPGVKAEQQE